MGNRNILTRLPGLLLGGVLLSSAALSGTRDAGEPINYLSSPEQPTIPSTQQLVGRNFLTTEREALRSLDEAKRADRPKLVLKKLQELIRLYSSKGHALAIIDRSNEALGLAKQLHDLEAEADLLTNIGNAYGELGNLNKAIRYQFAAKEQYESLGKWKGVAATLNNIAGLYWQTDNSEKFLEYQNKSLVLSRKIDNPSGTAIALLNLGKHYTETAHNPSKGLPLYLQALAILENTPQTPPVYSAFCLSSIAEAYFLLGKRDDARRYNDRAKQLIVQNGFEKSLFQTLLLDSRLAMEENRFDAAHRALDQAEKLTNRLKMVTKKTRIYKLRADIHAQQGKYEEALKNMNTFATRRISELESTNRQQTTITQAWFDNQENRKEIESLQNQKTLQILQLKEQQLTQRLLITGIIATTLVVLVLLLLVRQTRKSRSIITEKNQVLSQAITKAEKEARHDTLTGLLNRRGFMERLDYEYLQLKRQNNPLTLILADIDYFKKLNDHYGHNCGDKTLLAVARFLRNSVREQDTVCRWGGEEFLFMMPNTNLQEAQKLTERIRQRLEQNIFGCQSRQFTLSMTFGISECFARESLDRCISRADEALYRGKTSGRNKVSVSGTTTKKA